jgi:hypothetical protein
LFGPSMITALGPCSWITRTSRVMTVFKIGRH